MMIYNLGWLGNLIAFDNLCTLNYDSKSWIIAYWLFQTILAGSYAIAHWILASKYN
jgi:hypothetical protein